MRFINIANEKKRDAQVNFEAKVQKSDVSFVLADGSPKKTSKFLKTSVATDLPALEAQFGLENIADELISGDPEVNLEQTGMMIENAHRLYVTKEYEVVFGVNFEEVVYGPDGKEKERQDFVKKVSNINNEEIPLKWTGKKIPKEMAVRKFVFSKKYQLRHTSGLTYDFLFDMAKQLHEANALMMVGGGAKGNEPLVMYDNSTPHRAFLEGRVDGNRFMLILHLTNLELKELEA